jgi:hypothetical protein
MVSAFQRYLQPANLQSVPIMDVVRLVGGENMIRALEQYLEVPSYDRSIDALGVFREI